MPTKLHRYTLAFTRAQLKELRLRSGAEDDRQAIYLALGFEPPKMGGWRKGSGWPKGRPRGKPRKKKKANIS